MGLDLAKNVFQVHGINAAGDVIVRRRLRRSQVGEFFVGLESCLIGMDSSQIEGVELVIPNHQDQKLWQ